MITAFFSSIPFAIPIIQEVGLLIFRRMDTVCANIAHAESAE